MKIIKILFYLFLAMVLSTAALYWYYTSTPYYAVQEIALAVQDRDRAKLNERVDMDSLVSELLDDLLLRPAAATPNLTEFQMQVGMGAMAMVKQSVARQIDASLQRRFAGGREISRDFLMPPAVAAEGGGGLRDIGNILRAAGQEVQGELSRKKQEAFERMKVWLARHPDSVPGRLLGGDNRGNNLQGMLASYGFTRDDFRGIGGGASPSSGDNEVSFISLLFYSPRISQPIELKFELVKGYSSPVWKVVRISNVHELIRDLEPTYYDDVHELVAYSLVGLNQRNMNESFRGVGERLSKQKGVQDLLKRLSN